MNTSKVVLVQPPIEDFYLTKKRTLPYGLACIAGCIREKGFDVEILDGLATNKSKKISFPKEFLFLLPFYGKKDVSAFSLFHEFKHFGYSYEYLGTKIREKEPFLVGISSLFTAYGNQALKTAQAIKTFYPYCKIVMGGHHPTQFAEQILECSAVDFVLQGEGEKSMALLCEALKNNSAIKHIPGIAFKRQNINFVSEPAWISEFKDLPLPAMDLVNHKFYKRKNKNSLIVVSSRGCPMQCSYCSVSGSSNYAKFRQRTVEDVLEEIELQSRHQDIGFIDFEDENLCLNKSWFLKLFSGINKIFRGKEVELRAMNGLYPPAIDEDIIALMKKSGFKTLNLSLGSTSKYQLEKFKRPDVRASFENAIALAQKYNLECVSYIIAAAPGQTPQCSLEDLLYLARQRTLAGLSIFYPAPGSLDYKICKAKNILPQSFSLMRSTALALDDITSRTQAVTLLRLSRILNFMKHLIDTKGQIPEPEKFDGINTIDLSDRQKMSEQLLQWFLNDGKIRGIDSKGNIYIHNTDDQLSQQFKERIKTVSVAGVCGLRPQIL